jgi:predicted RNase H-like nuclease
MPKDVCIGFDSSWTDNAKAPGAICAVGIEGSRTVSWHPPRRAGFKDALAFIRDVRSPDGVTLIALDQPTLVPNSESMRRVERAAASVVSWLGGGVQAAHSGELGMFCPNSPIWPFLKAVSAIEDPESARTATEGTFLMEVFPALALPSLDETFAMRMGAPKYNPANRRQYKRADWSRVTRAVATEADELGCPELAVWYHEAREMTIPRKADQDKMDAGVCLAIALRWRLRPWKASIFIGDLVTGYMVTPASAAMRERLTAAAAKKGGVPVDGIRALPAYDAFGILNQRTDLPSLEESIASGFKAIKIKLGAGSADDDVAVVADVRRTTGDDVRLMLDFNQSRTTASAVERIRRLQDFDLTRIEEPVGVDDLIGHRAMRERVRLVPIQTGENWWFPRGMANAIATAPRTWPWSTS